MARSAKALREMIGMSRMFLQDSLDEPQSKSDSKNDLRSCSSAEYSTKDEPQSKSDLKNDLRSCNSVEYSTKAIEDLTSYLFIRRSLLFYESSFRTFGQISNSSFFDLHRPLTGHGCRRMSRVKVLKKRPVTAPSGTSEYIKCSIASKLSSILSISGELSTWASSNQTVWSTSDDSGHNKGFDYDPDLRKSHNGIKKQLIACSKSHVCSHCVNIENFLQKIDDFAVVEWLEASQKTLHQLISFFSSSGKFVRFAHFFLTKLAIAQYLKLGKMEFSIINDRLTYLLHFGRSSDVSALNDLLLLVQAIVPEFPRKLFGENGVEHMLDIVCALCGDKDGYYRMLLRNVCCATTRSQYSQRMLALRACVLISFIEGIAKFFMVVDSGVMIELGLARQECTAVSNSPLKGLLGSWTEQAVLLNSLDVVMYLCKHQNGIRAGCCGTAGMSLLAVAVNYQRRDIAEFFLKYKPKLDVDATNRSGNTALHIAARTGNLDIASLLIQHGADVNRRNDECQGSCPIHVAVMNGDVNMVELLLLNKADPEAKMGVPATVTPLSLARDLDHKEIAALLVRKL